MKLNEKDFELACRDYENGYLAAANYFAENPKHTLDEMLDMYDGELWRVFGDDARIRISHDYFLNGIEDFLYNLDSMRFVQNIHSINLSGRTNISEDGLCPLCGSGNVEPDEYRAWTEDGYESTPAKCNECGYEFTAVRGISEDAA